LPASTFTLLFNFGSLVERLAEKIAIAGGPRGHARKLFTDCSRTCQAIAEIAEPFNPQRGGSTGINEISTPPVEAPKTI
jgi:hypothetical protein